MGHYKDTVGLTIDIETGQDVNSATGIVLHVKKPDGKWYTWTNSITVQNDTMLRYMTQSGDLNLAGWYLLYPVLTLGGWTGPGNPDRFLIQDPQRPDRRYNK